MKQIPNQLYTTDPNSTNNSNNKSDIVLNSYAGKPIQFFKKDNIYYLIFGDEFKVSTETSPLMADLLKDLIIADKTCEIHVFVSSIGGEVDCLTELAEEIIKFANVVTICTSMAMSAGFALWLLGREKYISPLATLMYHGIGWYGYISGKMTEIKATVEATEIREFVMNEFFGYTKYLTKEEYEKGKVTEIYFSGIEAIKRKWAKPYSDYKNRMTFGVVQDKDGILWQSDGDGIFSQYKLVKNSKKLTLPQLNGFDE